MCFDEKPLGLKPCLPLQPAPYTWPSHHPWGTTEPTGNSATHGQHSAVTVHPARHQGSWAWGHPASYATWTPCTMETQNNSLPRAAVAEIQLDGWGHREPDTLGECFSAQECNARSAVPIGSRLAGSLRCPYPAMACNSPIRAAQKVHGNWNELFECRSYFGIHV